MKALENNIVNRLYYSSQKSNSLKSSNPQTTKNSYLFSSLNTKENNDEGFNNINVINGLTDVKISTKNKKIDFSDFTNYLDKLASYETNRKGVGKKY